MQHGLADALARLLMLPDLVDQYDRVADDDAEQRHDTQHDDKTEWPVRDEQSGGHPDHAERRREQRHDSLGDVLQLYHEDDEDEHRHDRHRLQEQGSAGTAVIRGAIVLDGIARRQAPTQISEPFIDLSRHILAGLFPRDLGADLDGGMRIPAENLRLLPLQRKRSYLPQRHIFPTGQADRERQDILSRLSGIPLDTEDNRQLAVCLQIGADLLALHRALQIARQALHRDAELAVASLIGGQMEPPAAVPGAEVHIAHSRLLTELSRYLAGDLPHLFEILALDAQHRRIRRSIAGPDDLAVRLDLRVFFAQQLIDRGLQLLPGREVFGHDDELRHVRFAVRRIKGQHEARRSLARMVGIVIDLRPLRQLAGKAGRHGLCLLRRGSCRQLQIDDEVQARRGREILLPQKLHAPDRQNEQQPRSDEDPHLVVDGPAQRVMIGSIEPFPIAGKASRHTALFRINEMIAQDWRHRAGSQPGGQQRDRDDHENRRAELGSTALGKPDRNEAGTGDERSRQHRERRDPIGIDGCGLPVKALLELHHHHLDDDHRIVDQESQAQDERPQRHPLQVDMQKIHRREHHGQHQRDAEGYDDACPAAQCQEAHGKDDHQCLDQRAHEIMDGTLHHARLVHRLMELHARGQQCRDALQLLLQAPVELEDAFPDRHRDRDADGRLPLIEELRLSRHQIRPLHLCHIGQMEHLPILGDGQCPEVSNALENTVRAQVQAVLLRHELPAPRDLVVRLHRADDVCRRDAQLGQLVDPGIDIDGLGLHPQQLDLLRLRHMQQALADFLCLLPHILIAVAIRGGQRIDHAINIVKMVIDHRGRSALRQRRLLLKNEVARIRPEARDILFHDGILQIDVDDALFRQRVALHIREALQALQLLLQLVRDLLLYLPGRRSRPPGDYNHLAHRIVRILHAPQVLIGIHPQRGQQADQEYNEMGMLQAPFGQIEILHQKSSPLTGIPSCSFSTPAATMRSPGARPLRISTCLPKSVPSTTGVKCTVPSCSRQTPFTLSRSKTAASGTCSTA